MKTLEMYQPRPSSLSSYSEKTRWGRDCEMYVHLNYFGNFTTSRTFLNDCNNSCRTQILRNLSVAASVKCFLMSLTKVFSFTKLLQQSTRLQVFFSGDMMCKIILSAIASFYRNKPLQNDRSINNVLRKSAIFFVYNSYPRFSGALIFRKNKNGFAWVIFATTELLQS